MRGFLRCAVLLIVVCVARDAALADACVTDKHGGLVCGDGDGAVRVFAETTSPSKAYAFAWRSSDGLATSGGDAPSDVENVLIRISDGAVLAKLGGQYWSTGEMRANRYDLLAAWSPDSRAVVEVANSRWDSESFAYYLVGDKVVAKVDLLALIKPAAKAKIPAKQRSNYAFRVREELPVTLDAYGHLRFSASVFRPKSDEDGMDYKVQIDIGSKNGKPKPRLVSMQRAKLD